MSEGEMPDDLRSESAVRVPGEFADVADAIWRRHEISDAQLRENGTQETFARACSHELGPVWAEFIADLRSVLEIPPYWVILRLSRRLSVTALLAAVAASLGTLCEPYQASWSRVLQEIATKKVWSPDLEWHTDSTGWPNPNSFTALSCIRTALGGGATDLLSLATAWMTLARDEPESLRILESTRFPWPLDTDLGGGSVADLILAEHRVRFMRAALLQSHQDELRLAVQRMISVIDMLPPDAAILLAPGDVLVFDNRRAFHRRGKIDDAKCERLLLRVKIWSHEHAGPAR